MAIRRDTYQSVGGLDQAIFPLDDYDLQLRVAASGAKVHHEHRSLARYRVHGANESGPERAVKVGIKKVECLVRARRDYLAIKALGSRGRRRIGEARRELAISLLRTREWSRGLTSLWVSLTEDPRGLGDLLKIAWRKLDNQRNLVGIVA